MAYFLISFEIIFPLLVYMSVGYFIKRIKMAKEPDFDAINRMIFHIFLPLKLFLDIISSDFKAAFQIKLIGFNLAGILICFLLFSLIVPRFIKDRRTAPVVINGISRGNFVIFGLSVAANIYPGRNLGVVSVLAAFTVPLFNIASVVLFELYRGEKATVKKLLIEIIKNKFVLAALIGGIAAFLNVKLPYLLLNPLSSIASLAVTLALICLGASFSFRSMKKYIKVLAVTSLFRLLIIPCIFISAGVLIGYRDIELSAIMLLFGAPAAAASYPVAKEMGGNYELAGMIIAVTSVASILSMLMWILTLKSFQFI